MLPVARFTQTLEPVFFERVQARVREQLVGQHLDAFLTDDPEDIAYLTGFFHHPCERPVAVWIAANGRAVLLLPQLERENADRQHTNAEIISYGEFPGIVPPFASLARAVDRVGGGEGLRVGFTTHITHERLSAISEQLPAAKYLACTIVIQARYLKFDEEIVLHREAARVTDLMLDAGITLIRQAVSSGGQLPSEAELAAHVISTGVSMMYAEHDNVVVVSPLAGGLVYAGANSAFPHGLPSGYRLSPGDTFILSLGCAVGGRFVEGERTFVLGKPTSDQLRFHDTIRRAQSIGMQAIRPGTKCSDANAACLAVIEDAGLGGYIRHRQGHGIGLSMHEPPWLEAGDDTLLQPGMIVSNEPGIYIAGHAGYRISDSMLVTDSGSESLTVFPRGLDHCAIEL